jgi:hypothetical protein
MLARQAYQPKFEVDGYYSPRLKVELALTDFRARPEGNSLLFFMKILGKHFVVYKSA